MPCSLAAEGECSHDALVYLHRPGNAHVGLYERDARETRHEIDTYVREFKEVDRAVLDGEEDGFVKFHVRKGRDEILGATIVARHAGEMISETVWRWRLVFGLGKLASVIHPYPRSRSAPPVRRCLQSDPIDPAVKKWMGRWLACREA